MDVPFRTILVVSERQPSLCELADFAEGAGDGLVVQQAPNVEARMGEGDANVCPREPAAAVSQWSRADLGRICTTPAARTPWLGRCARLRALPCASESVAPGRGVTYVVSVVRPGAAAVGGRWNLKLSAIHPPPRSSRRAPPWVRERRLTSLVANSRQVEGGAGHWGPGASWAVASRQVAMPSIRQCRPSAKLSSFARCIRVARSAASSGSSRRVWVR